MITIDDFTARLRLYKRELPRRGLFLLLLIFLPAVILLAVATIYFDLLTPPFWKISVVYGLFFILLVAMLGSFIYGACVGLPRKIGLTCPKCHSFFILFGKNDEFCQTGKCSKCGEQVVDLKR